MRSVRPPNLVPNRMNSEVRNSSGRSFRGRRVAVSTSTPRGFLAIKSNAAGRQSPFSAGCVNRQRSLDHKVPRSHAHFAGQLRGRAWPLLSAGSSVWVGGVWGCLGARAVRSASLERGPLLCGTDDRRLRAMQRGQFRKGVGVGSLTTASSAA